MSREHSVIEQLTEQTIRNKLAELNISFKEYEHPPLATSSDAEKLGIARSGQQIKNLFVCDNYKRRHFLLLVLPEATVDLKALSKQLQVSRLGLTSSRRLMDHLGVEAGCVSFLSLCHSGAENVEVLVDNKIWQADKWQAHPAINSKTYVINKDDVLTLYQRLSNAIVPINFPEVAPVDAE